MSKKARYLILALGFIVFLILAPLTVLYVSGITYDFKSGHFIRTGIMGFKVDPKDASIYIDGKLAKKTASNLDFLKPGEYEVKVSRLGYHDWTKRLRIEANKVTWASPVPNKLTLFLQDNPISEIANNVLDFYINDKSTIYLTKTAVTISTPDLPQDILPLPAPVDTITPSADGNFAALWNKNGSTQLYIFDFKARKVTDISSMFTSPVTVQFSGNNELYVLEDGNLEKVQWKNKTKTLQAAAVKSFYLQGNNLYLLRDTATSSILTLADSSSLEEQVLASALPIYTNAQIIVNFQKQIFLLADGSLCILNNNLQKLTDNITEWNFSPADSSLTVLHSGQLDFFNFFDQKLNFITRSGVPIKNPVLEPAISYAFFFQGNTLKALELDTRDHQNEYTFYTAANPQKFLIDSAIENAYVLDNGSLKSIKIR